MTSVKLLLAIRFYLTSILTLVTFTTALALTVNRVLEAFALYLLTMIFAIFTDVHYWEWRQYEVGRIFR